MKKLTNYYILLLLVHIIYLQSIASDYKTTPDILAILGMDPVIYDQYQLFLLNPFHIFSFILLIVIQLFYSLDKLNESSGLFRLAMVRVGRKQYFLHRIKRIITLTLESISLLYGMVIVFRILVSQFNSNIIIFDILFLVKIGIYICILLLIYEFTTYKLSKYQILVSQIIFTMVLIIFSLNTESYLLNYTLNIDIAIVSILWVFISFMIVSILKYTSFMKGELL